MEETTIKLIDVNEMTVEERYLKLLHSEDFNLMSMTLMYPFERVLHLKSIMLNVNSNYYGLMCALSAKEIEYIQIIHVELLKSLVDLTTLINKLVKEHIGENKNAH